jgi:hypothetical protein
VEEVKDKVSYGTMCCAVFFSDSHFLLLFSSGGVIADEEAKQKTLNIVLTPLFVVVCIVFSSF